MRRAHIGPLFGALVAVGSVSESDATEGLTRLQREEGDPVDTFRWDLPDPAHERGSQIHGILELEEE